MRDSDGPIPSSPGERSGRPLFTAADVALVEDAIRREGQRIFAVCELFGIVIDPDDHAAQLRDLAARLRHYLGKQAPAGAP